MAWRIEVTPTARGDLDVIFDHVVRSYDKLGYDLIDGVMAAENRIGAIMASARRLTGAPQRGTRVPLAGREMRHVTIDRAIFWFTVDAPNEIVRIEAIFHGGQDHLGHMLARLSRETGAD